MDTIPQGIPQKQCSKCKDQFDATLQFFHKDKARPDGLTNQCKKCRNAKHQNSRKLPETQEKERIYQETYHSQPEIKERYKTNRKIYESLPEVHKHIKIYGETYRNRPDIQKREQERKKIYRSDPEMQEQERIDRIAYYARPDVKEKYRIHSLNRRGVKKAATGTHTLADIQAQRKRQNGICYYCHQKLTKYHVDHIIPLSRGGSNGPENLVITCPKCNLSKHDKLPHEWLEGGRLL